MKRTLILLFALVLSVTAHAQTKEKAKPKAQPAPDDTRFALDLYRQLRATPGNLFLSPYSIATCLGMTYAGARGETEQQMQRALHFGSDPTKLHARFAEQQRQLQQLGQQKGLELSVANALWAQKDAPFLPPFLAVAKDQYQATVQSVDFPKRAKEIRGEINQWVAQKTQQRIPEILPPDSLSPLTKLVLVNAIYFKGDWESPFEKSATTPQPFHVDAKRKTTAQLMHRTSHLRYTATDTLQAVELPYQGGQLAMVILLPRQIRGLNALEKQLTPALLTSTLASLKSREVEVFLPRFQLNSGFNLKPTLTHLGMTNAFGTNADFSGMTGNRSLRISAVIHQAWGQVNEQGTEAAAATAIAMMPTSARLVTEAPPVFRADHPFVFLIRDVRSGTILFLGRLTDPKE